MFVAARTNNFWPSFSAARCPASGSTVGHAETGNHGTRPRAIRKISLGLPRQRRKRYFFPGQSAAATPFAGHNYCYPVRHKYFVLGLLHNYFDLGLLHNYFVLSLVHSCFVLSLLNNYFLLSLVHNCLVRGNVCYSSVSTCEPP